MRILPGVLLRFSKGGGGGGAHCVTPRVLTIHGPLQMLGPDFGFTLFCHLSYEVCIISQ